MRTDYTAVSECGERKIGIRSQGDTKELIDQGYKILKEYSNKYDNDKNNKWRGISPPFYLIFDTVF